MTKNPEIPRATHTVYIGPPPKRGEPDTRFGFPAHEPLRGVLRVVGGPSHGETIATRHGARWLLSTGKEADVREHRPRPESTVGARSVRTWPAQAEIEGRETLVEAEEVWNGAAWDATGEFRAIEFNRPARLLLSGDENPSGKDILWYRDMGRWTREFRSSDPGRWWREGGGKGRGARA